MTEATSFTFGILSLWQGACAQVSEVALGLLQLLTVQGEHWLQHQVDSIPALLFVSQGLETPCEHPWLCSHLQFPPES